MIATTAEQIDARVIPEAKTAGLMYQWHSQNFFPKGGRGCLTTLYACSCVCLYMCVFIYTRQIKLFGRTGLNPPPSLAAWVQCTVAQNVSDEKYISNVLLGVATPALGNYRPGNCRLLYEFIQRDGEYYDTINSVSICKRVADYVRRMLSTFLGPQLQCSRKPRL